MVYATTFQEKMTNWIFHANLKRILLTGIIILGNVFIVWLSLRNTSRNVTGFHSQTSIQYRHWLIQQRVKRVCAQNQGTNFQNISQISERNLQKVILDRQHKVLYCFIPKVACTNWKRVWLILTKQVNTTDPLSVSSDDVHTDPKRFFTLGQVRPSERQKIVNSYFKFVIIRNPLERLISAYRDKISPGRDVYHKYYHDQVVQTIQSATMTKVNFKRDREGKLIIPLDSFIKFLKLQSDMREDMDEHWKNQVDICHPCIINYDVIGKFEDADAEADYILRKTNLDHLARFPRRNVTHQYQRSAVFVKDLLNNLSDDMIITLYKIYHRDYNTFGFPYLTFQRDRVKMFIKDMEQSISSTFVNRYEES